MARGQWKFVFEYDYGAALSAFVDALAWSDRAGDTRWAAFSHALLGWLYNALGDFTRSEEALRRAIASSHRTGQAGLIGRLVLSWTHAMQGRMAEADLEVTRALERSRGNGYAEGMARTTSAYSLMHRGDLDAAAREMREALGLLEMTPLLRTIALAATAEIYLKQGRAREALALAREALGDEAPCRIYPSSEYCARLTEILALEALDDQEGAREALTRADERLRAQAATIEDESLRESFLRKPPWNDRIVSLITGRRG
jgi:tetratricopeptide (TPR) repeat protein